MVKVFNQQQTMLEAAEVLNERQFRAQRSAQFADFAIYPTIRALGQLGFIATAVLGGDMALRGVITLGTAQAFLQYVSQIAEPVMETAYVITSLQAESQARSGSSRSWTRRRSSRTRRAAWRPSPQAALPLSTCSSALRQNIG